VYVRSAEVANGLRLDHAHHYSFVLSIIFKLSCPILSYPQACHILILPFTLSCCLNVPLSLHVLLAYTMTVIHTILIHLHFIPHITTPHLAHHTL
jgi:hypothetical protein